MLILLKVNWQRDENSTDAYSRLKYFSIIIVYDDVFGAEEDFYGNIKILTVVFSCIC